MKEVWVNHKLVDFTNAARQQKITPGCALLQEEEEEQMEDDRGNLEEDVDRDEEEDDDDDLTVKDPCLSNNCKSGSTCVPKKLGEYTCKCPAGWTGKYCETGN